MNIRSNIIAESVERSANSTITKRVISFFTQSEQSIQRRLITALIVTAVSSNVVIYLRSSLKHKRLIERAQEKKQQRDLQILNEFTPTIEIPEEVRKLVLDSTVTKLLQLLNDDSITSEQILRVYHNRAISTGLQLELIADSNFPEALRAAKEYDIIRKNTPKEERYKLGSLFGIPISIKDSIQQKGLDSTCGLARFCFQPCQDDGLIIKLLKAQGAIPFIRTNVPQVLRSFDCSNNIWGRGINPWDSQRTIGGSSGGDAGLVASKCSPIGFGSDVYGSVRLPAAFAGVYAFKPTSVRYPPFGHSSSTFYDALKFSVLKGGIGPLARSVDDIVQLVRGLIDPENRKYNLSSPVIEWNEEKYNSKKKFRIGYVVSEDFFEAAKPCKRAVLEAVAALRLAGHDAVEIKIPSFEAMVLNIIRLLTSEGRSRGLKDALGDEKANNDLAILVEFAGLPSLLKRIVRPFLGLRAQMILDHTIEPSTNELTLIGAKLITLKNEFLQFWVSSGFDAIITPPVALPAFKHGHGSKLFPASCYLWPANLCDLPAGVVPVTQVMAGEDVYEVEDSKYKNDVFYKGSQECMNGSVGLPVGVQVLGLPWEEEKCLAVMKAIEDSVDFHKLPNVI